MMSGGKKALIIVAVVLGSLLLLSFVTCGSCVFCLAAQGREIEERHAAARTACVPPSVFRKRAGVFSSSRDPAYWECVTADVAAADRAAQQAVAEEARRLQEEEAARQAAVAAAAKAMGVPDRNVDAGVAAEPAPNKSDVRSANASDASTSSDAQAPVSLTPPATPALKGFGATRAAWNAAHQPAPGRYTPGMVYGPMFQHPDEPGLVPTYATVIGRERIISYMVHFPAGTNFEAARNRMLAELPSDAREVRRRRQDACWSIIYSSATLEPIIETNPRGRVEIFFFSRNLMRFNPRGVNSANISIFAGPDIDC